MSQLLKIVLTAAAVIAISVISINKYNDTVESYEYQLARADLRADYLERAASVRAIQDPVRYEEEIRGLFKWYVGQLTELNNRYPAYKGGEDGYLKELEARKAAGQLDDEEFAAYKASYDQVKEIWDLIKAGRYSPELTAADGAMRIDFLEFEPTMIDGEKGVKGRFVLWGAQRRKLEEKAANGVVSYRYDVQASFQGPDFKLTGKDGKPVAEASGVLPSGPYVPYPEQKLADFPPMAYIGTFAFPVLPHTAMKAQIESAVVSRSTTGRDIEARFTWNKDVPTAWKLAEGEEWTGADVEEREELAR